jgi:large subunit ribosomal protein L17
MKHLMKGRRLNRSPTHRIALKRNMACHLFANERIITTVAKAKELRPFAERLITIAKKGAAQLSQAGDSEAGKAARVKALHYRRRLMQLLGGKKIVEVGPDRINIIDKLLNDIGPRFETRPGGYTRIVKRTQRRLGDAAPTAFIELLGANDKAESKKAAAPVVKE